MTELTVRARHTEDVVVGEEIVRHRLSSRIIHWGVALFFFVCLGTGMPIWMPVFGWMASFFGGLAVCRWLHPWSGVAFFFFSTLMFFHWFREMRLEKNERDWLGPKMIQYFRYNTDDSEVGKYNGGQKLFFDFTMLLAVLLFATGLMLWFPLGLSPFWREAAIIVHDVSFFVFFAAIIVHVYLGTAAEPGTFGAMVRGTVSKAWARFHHPRWFRQVTGEERKR